MRPLIHKASVRLSAPELAKNVSLGDPLTLRCEDGEKITVIWEAPSRLPFGIGKERSCRLGSLGDRATAILKNAVVRKARLRVRIVEIEPAHVRTSGHTRLFISVWGDPKDMTAFQPKKQIFSRSRIHDGPTSNDED